MTAKPLRFGFTAATPVLVGSQVRSGQAKLRKLAISAAQGVCASCKTDVEALRLVYEAERDRVLTQHPPVTREGWDPQFATPENLETARRAEGRLAALEVDKRWRALGFKRGTPVLEADHIEAVWIGGRSDASNVVGICRPCHRKKTDNDASVRAEKASKRVGVVAQKEPKPPRHAGPSRRRKGRAREVGDRCPTCSRKGLVEYANGALMCESCGQVVPRQ